MDKRLMRASKAQRKVHSLQPLRQRPIRPLEQTPAPSLAPLFDERRTQGNRNQLTILHLRTLQRTVGNRGVERMLARCSPSLPTVQRKPENEKALRDIQGHAMSTLLPELQKLPKEVRTDIDAGGFVGGPRLVTVMHAVQYKDEGKTWSEFADDYHNELVGLKSEDQIGDVMKFLGASARNIKTFQANYVQAIALGWKGVKTGPNTQEIRVGSKGQPVGPTDDGIRRIPLQIDRSRQAIVLIPAKLNPANPIDVLLHLHGHNVGYQGGSLEIVRDIQKDQIEQQLLATGRSQMIAVLPQGSAKSVFQDVNTTTYVGSVFTALNHLGVWGKNKDDNPVLVKPEGHNVLLSAHSGGGALLSSLLERAGKPANPGGLKGLFLFDSINAAAIPKKNPDGSIARDDKNNPISSGKPDVSSSTELRRIRAFVAYQLDLELKQLDEMTKLPNGTPDSDQNLVRRRQLQFVEKSGFRVRGYYTPGWYAKIYDPLVNDIDAWFNKTVTTRLPNLDKQVADRWSKNYVVQSINAVSQVGPVDKGHGGHDYIVGQGIPSGKAGKDYDPAKGGALQDALSSI